MARSIGRALLKVAAFGYGLFTLGLYGLTAVFRGIYFKWPSEKDKLELKLGAYLPVVMWSFRRLVEQYLLLCRSSLIERQLEMPFGICPRTGLNGTITS